MKKHFSKSSGIILLGVFIIILAGLTVAVADVPIIWIGGFIWGISLIAQGMREENFPKREWNKEKIAEDGWGHNKKMDQFGTTKQAEAVVMTKMKRCPFCKNEIPDYAMVCPTAGCRRILAERVSTPVVTWEAPKLTKTPNQAVSASGLKFPFNGGPFSIFKKHWGKLLAMGLILLVVGIAIGYSGNDSKVSTEPIPKIHAQAVPSDSIKVITPAVTGAVNTTVAKPVYVRPVYSLSNGTILKSRSAYQLGDGELLIKNGTDADAVAKLIFGGTSVFTVYVKSKNNYTIRNITDGTYYLVFALGNDWEPDSKSFSNDKGYEKFEEAFDFRTTTYQDDEYEHARYSVYEVTLNPVIGGTAVTNDIDQADFEGY